MKRPWRRGYLDTLRVGSLVTQLKWPDYTERKGIVIRFSKRGAAIVAWEDSLISPVFQAFKRLKY